MLLAPDTKPTHHPVVNGFPATLLAALLAGCTTFVAPRFPRPTKPVPVAPVTAPELIQLAHHDHGRSTGILRGDGEEVCFELRSPTSRSDSPRPLVLLVPILAGGRALMSSIAQRLVNLDFDVAFCDRAGSALSPPDRGPELDDLFRRTVLHQRLLLAWLRQRDQQPPPSMHVLGLSMGGMISTVLAAHEPDLDGVAICLAGADLADMVVRTSERRVIRWRDWRHTADGVGKDALHWELQQMLRHEPARFAPGVATAKVLFVSAIFDTVVPPRNQQLLWESLGRPRRLCVPFGHYSAALAVDRVIGAAAEHFRSRG